MDGRIARLNMVLGSCDESVGSDFLSLMGSRYRYIDGWGGVH